MPANPAPAAVLRRALCWAGAALLVAAINVRAQQPECGTDKEVRQLDFTGNETFSDRDLGDLVVTTPSSWARRHFGFLDPVTRHIPLVGFSVGTVRCFDAAEFKLDVERLRRFYKGQGFFSASVDTTVRALNPEAVAVTFAIKEGPPTLLDSLSITGLDAVPKREEVLKDIGLAVGQRFGDVLLAAAIDSITERLHNGGFPYAHVFPAVTTHEKTRTAEAALNVDTGPHAVFGTTEVEETRPDQKPARIPKDRTARLVGIDSSTPYREQSIADAQRNLFQTGAFRHVEVAAAIDTGMARPDTIIGIKVVAVEEDLHEFTPQVGWATLDCFRGSAQYTDKNVFSQFKQLDLTGRVSKIGRHVCPDIRGDFASEHINYFLSASLHEPPIANGWTPAYSLYTERRGEYLVYLHTTNIGGDASATRLLTPRQPLRVASTLEYGSTNAPPAVLCSTFFRCDSTGQDALLKRLRLFALSASYQRDGSNSPFNPTRGTILRLEGRVSLPPLSDEALTFVKGTADAVWYHSLGGDAVVAARIRYGAAITGSHDLPPQERLYAGGATSVRGFQQNLLGNLTYLVDRVHPDTVGGNVFLRVDSTVEHAEQTIPAGGTRLIVANLDFRFRLFFPNVFQETLFIDGGQVYTRQEGVASPSVRSILWTPGLGVRYFSPVGPIQVNVGYNPSPETSGPAYLRTVQTQGGFAPLLCVSRDNTLPVHVVGAQFVQDSGLCPQTFRPKKGSHWYSPFVITFSIGPDF